MRIHDNVSLLISSLFLSNLFVVIIWALHCMLTLFTAKKIPKGIPFFPCNLSILFFVFGVVPQPSQKRKLLITISVVQNDLRTVKCCQENCLHYIPLETAVDCRNTFWTTKTQAEQRNFMMSTIRHCRIAKNGRRFFRIQTCEQDLCRTAWCTVYGIKDTRWVSRRRTRSHLLNKHLSLVLDWKDCAVTLLHRYKDVLKLINEGLWSVDGKRCCFPSTAFEIARRWFKQFAFMSDVMPTTGSKHLPSCLSKRSIYMLYEEEMARRGKNVKLVISKTHFIHRMWKKEFPNVKIPKVYFS